MIESLLIISKSEEHPEVKKIRNDAEKKIETLRKKTNDEIEKIQDKMNKDVENKINQIKRDDEIKKYKEMKKEAERKLAELEKVTEDKTFSEIVGKDKTKPKPNKINITVENNPAKKHGIVQLCRGHGNKTDCGMCHTLKDMIDQSIDLDSIIFIFIGLAESANKLNRYKNLTDDQMEFHKIREEYIDYAKTQTDDENILKAFDLIANGNKEEYNEGRRIIRDVMKY